MRHEYVASSEDSLLLIIDFQQSMRKVMPDWEQITANVKKLLQAAQILEVPILVTEQYIKGLGETHPQVLAEIQSPRVFRKEHFSACLEPDFLPTVRSFQRTRIVVAGLETHVCVLQTCLDLIHAGFRVHIAADAVASRLKANRVIALDLLRQAGAVVSSVETVIFQWACRANTAPFRRILPIIR